MELPVAAVTAFATTFASDVIVGNAKTRFTGMRLAAEGLVCRMALKIVFLIHVACKLEKGNNFS